MASAYRIEDVSNAAWMVMVHGMSQDRQIFSKQVDAFRDRYRLLLIDLPGHGSAIDVPGPYGHSEFTDHVLREIFSAGVEDIHFWGTHTGATVGLLAAAREPDRFRSLILEGPGIPGENPTIVTQILTKMRVIADRDGIAAARRAWWEQSCWFDAMRKDPVTRRAEAHWKIVREFSGKPWIDKQPPSQIDRVREGITKITCPALVYTGEEDHEDFQAAADEIAERLAAADRKRIADAGGFPAWEAPEALNAVVKDFMRRSI